MMFKGPSHFKLLVRSVCAVLIAACSGATAQDNGELAFCAEGERYYPDGQIVEVGDRYFFICKGDFAFPPRVNTSFVTIDRYKAFIDEATQVRFPGLRYDGYIRDRAEVHSARPYPGIDVKVGEITLGGLPYSVFLSKIDAERLDRPVGVGMLPGSVLLHYRGNGDDEVPEHFLHCNTDPTAKPTHDYFCRLHIRLDRSDRLYITHTIAYAEGLPLGLRRDPFDFERLGWQARGMEFVAEQMDVTDRLDKFEGVPIARAEQ